MTKPVTARDAVLKRIREALGSDPSVPEVPRDYTGAALRPATVPDGAFGNADMDLLTTNVEMFCERVTDYQATVVQVDGAALTEALTAACYRRGSSRILAAPEAKWLDAPSDSTAIQPPELDTYDAALTGCAVAIAQTGTIVLDGSPLCGRRALTLVPDHHLCVVRVDQIVQSVPNAISHLADAATEGRPLTFISGPSATSDIELERVEGVHGPRQLDVFVVT